MRPDRGSLPLPRHLNERVFARDEVRAVVAGGFAGLAAELRARPRAPHTIVDESREAR